MPPHVIALLWIAGVAAALAVLVALVYLLILVRPRGRAPADKALLCDYAHRGLHGGEAPENSMAAFRRAVEAGCGIELDVQLSADGAVMVFHDYTLARMTGDHRKLAELTAAELKSLRLGGTDEGIPTFREVLDLVDGRIPLLVELKGEDLNAALCPKVAEILRDYKGPFCLESFNPLLIREMQKHLPGAFCGLLYTDVVREKKKASPLNVILSSMGLNFLCRPHFIAFDERDRRSLPVRLATGLYNTPKFVWTVRSRAGMDTAHACGEHAIFEGVTP